MQRIGGTNWRVRVRSDRVACFARQTVSRRDRATTWFMGEGPTAREAEASARSQAQAFSTGNGGLVTSEGVYCSKNAYPLESMDNLGERSRPLG